MFEWDKLDEQRVRTRSGVSGGGGKAGRWRCPMITGIPEKRVAWTCSSRQRYYGIVLKLLESVNQMIVESIWL